MRKKIENFIKIYGPVAPILLAMVPFLLSILMILYYTNGNTANTSYIIGEVGILQIWLSGLTGLVSSVVYSLLIGALVVIIFFWKNSNSKPLLIVCAGLVLVVSLNIMPMLPLLLGIILVISIGISERIGRNKSKKPTSLDSDFRSVRWNFAFFLVALLVGVLASYPDKPVSIITLTDQSIKRGTILVQNTNTALVRAEGDSNHLSLILTKDITRQQICSKKKPIPYISESVTEIISRNKLVPDCE